MKQPILQSSLTMWNPSKQVERFKSIVSTESFQRDIEIEGSMIEEPSFFDYSEVRPTSMN